MSKQPKSKDINTIPFIVVKSLLKSAKIHGKYAELRAITTKSSFLNIWLQKIKNNNAKELGNITSFAGLAIWAGNQVHAPARFTIGNIPEHEYPALFKYITDLTNILLRHIYEVRGTSMKVIGSLGQTTYNLACQQILKDKFVNEEEDTREISEINDPEELKSRLFHEYMKSAKQGKDDYSAFMEERMASFSDSLRRHLADTLSGRNMASRIAANTNFDPFYDDIFDDDPYS